MKNPSRGARGVLRQGAGNQQDICIRVRLEHLVIPEDLPLQPIGRNTTTIGSTVTCYPRGELRFRLYQLIDAINDQRLNTVESAAL